ncbi:unnamed protein product [Lampetra fluviatilis]
MNPGQSEVYIENKVLLPHDERERVQKKTFTKWVNSHLVKSKRQVNDLYEDLRDGHNLISLLELLSGEMLPRERGSMLVHKMQNIKIALDFMQRRQIKLVNIRSDDIAEGNPKLTLGLIWTIILHFQVSDIQVGEQHRDLGAKERLLLWVRRVVQEYPDLRCDNFTTSWRDGRLFNAIIHRHRPDLLDMKKVYQQNNQQNLEQAFSLAEQNLRVPRLLDTEDVDVKSPEEKSVVTYVAALYEAFPKIPADGITIYEVDKKWKEYETKISFLLSWIKEKMQKVESQGSTMSQEELKILLLQLKEKDIPGRDGEKASIEKLYKAFQVWINFGRIKVAPGQSPADVEKELGKLVKVIQAGEMKAQQEASRAKAKAEQEAKEKAKAEAAAKEAQAKEAEAKAKAQEEARAKAKAEALAKAQEEEKVRLIAQQQTKVRFQADAAAKALADSIAKQQEEARAKEAEAKESEAVKAKEAEEARLRAEAEARALAESLSKAQAEAKAEAEADQKLNFIKDLMALMEEKQMEIESADWGIDLSSVGANLQSHKNLHQVLEALNTKVVEAQAYESKVPASRKKNYTDSLAALTATYNKSLAASGARSTRLQELLAFLAPAEAELAWAKGQETEQLERDWSDKNADMEAQRKSLDASQKKLNEKQPIFADIKKLGEKLLSDKHPAKSTIEASLEGIGAQWAWLTQLGACGETHLQENAAYFQFFRDVDDTGKELSAARDSLNQAYACDASTDVPRLESLLQQTHTEQRLVPLRGKVHELVGRSQSVLNLKPRRPGHTLKDPVTVMAITDYTQPEVTVKKDQEYELKDNSDATRWRVASVGRKDATVPSVCFVLPSPNPDALQAAERLRQQHKDILAAWNGKTADLRSLLAWHHLLQYTKIIRAWDLPTLKKLALGQKEEALKELERRRQAFLEERATSQAPGDAETAQAEAEVSTCKQHYYIYILQFLQQKEKERKKKEITFSGLRQEVTLEELVESEIIDENTAGQLIEGTKSVTDVSPSIEQYLGGGRSIAGLYVEATKEKMPIDVAIKKNLLTLGTGMVLLEAQAATGSMIDPLNNTKLSVDEAVQKGLVSPEYQEKLKLAERAVTGYTDPITKKTISLFEAMEKEIILKQHGIRILEAQIATGGIIDPQNSHRLPIEVAYKRGLFDKKLHATLLDPNVPTPAVGVPQKEGPHISSEELAVENLKKTTLDLPFGSLAGKKYTLQEIFDGDLIDKHKKDQLMRDYKSGKISLEELMIFIIEIIRLKEREKTKKSITFHGIRTDVTVDELVRSGLLKEDVANQLADGLITQDEVQKQVGGYLGGSSAIAGLYVEGTKETISLYDGFKRNLIKTGTGLVLLEAQAASGFIIDPVKNEKLSVEEAVQKGVVGPEYKDKLLSAERAVTGYKDKFSGATFSVFQAMQNKQILKQHGIRLLEAQIATGGIIDPQASHRLPVEAAYKRGLFDEEMNQILSDPSDDTKGFFDPNTEENLTYMEQMQRCIIDPVTGLTLLPIKEKKGKKAEKKVPTQKEVAKATDEAKKLAAAPVPKAVKQEDVEALKKTTVNIQLGRFAGKNPSLNELFQSGLIAEEKRNKLLEDYKSGRISKEQLILYIIEFITESEQQKPIDEPVLKSAEKVETESEQHKPEEASEEPVLKAAETVQSVLPDGVPLKPTKVPAEELQAIERLKKTTVDLPFGKFAGKKYTLQDIFDSDLVDEDKKKQLMIDYKTGKITLEQLMLLIIEIIRLNEREKTKKAITFHGIRTDVTVDNLVKSGVLKEDVANQLADGLITKDDVQKQVRKYLGGSNAIAGLYIEKTKEKMSLYDGLKKKLIKPGTGLVLLEAQAASGFIIDPVKDQKLSVEEAVQKGVVGKEYQAKLLSAERAVTGYKDPFSKETLSLFQAMKKELILQAHGIRLLEAQIATGGIIDPQASHRLPVEVAYKRGLFDEEMNQILSDPSDDTKGFFDPNTEENLTYMEQMQRCIIDPDTGLTLLPIKEKKGKRPEKKAIERLKKTTVDLPFGKFAGKKYTLQDIFDSDLVEEDKKKQLMIDYKTGKITLEQLMLLIIEIIRLNEREKTKKAITFHGIRTDVTVDNLVKSGVLKEDVANQLADGLITKDDVQKQVRKYLGGSNAIAGLYIEKTKEKMSLYDGLKKKLIKLGTGLVLLEAQAASGFIIDPVKDQKLSVEEAVQKGVVGEEYQDKLLSAERAVTGYKDPFSKETLSLFQAMKKELILKAHGIRLLEAQIATGGIIDPQASHRLPVEAAYKRGLFDEEMNQILSDPSDDTKGFFDPNTEENLTYMEQMQRCIIDPDTGLTLLPIKEKKGKRPEKKSPITFKGFRRQVTISELMDSGLINETTASKLNDGSVSVNEVSESLKVFLEGTSSIAGVFVDRTKEILSIYAAMKRGLIRPGTAFELLEAQAATGYIIDPVKKQKLLVEEAIKLGVVGEEFKDKLLSAERAVTGYKDPYTDQKISIFQAMKKQMIVKNHGIRLLEAQIATGGIIDPHASHRIPVELAYKRGLFDEEMNQILLDPSDDTKGFFDPNTEENLTYMELLQRCSKDSSGLYLLMLKDKKPERKMSSKSSVRKRKIIVVDPDTGKEMTVYEAYMKGLIDQPTYLQLSAQESEWEEITITSSDGVTTSLLVDRKSGRQFSIDESLAEGVINEQTVQLYRSGKMTIFELGDQLSGTSSGSRSRSSSFGASSVPASPQAGSKAPSVPWSDPTEETVPIGGILDLQKFEKISITEAIRRNLVDTITGQRLLEAQACTGGIINPATGGRCSIPEAVTQGLLDKYMADKLNQANKAYNGFEDLRTKAIFHTGQAMKKGLLFQEAGTRIFEVQYLTGGIIDSGKPERIQLDEAVEKGIVDNYTAKKIRDVNSHLKYLVCPKTKARITFKDALDRSMTDEETGVRLLEASGLTSRYSASTPSSGFGSRSGSRPGSRRGSFDATGTGTSSTFLSPSSYTSTSFSRR